MTDAETRPLLDWLLRKFPNTPRSRAKQWILAGRASVNGIILRKPHQMMPDPGDTLELGGREAAALDCVSGWRIHPRVSLLYLDTALAVVNKGPGLIAVPAPNADLTALGILADFLSGRLKAQDRGVAGKSLPAPYRRLELLPVHRLDQYTSGVFCMATNPGARQILIEQLRAHTMKREYVAFVEGRPPASKGTWRNFVRLSPDELRQNVLSPQQAKTAGSETREAITYYEVIAGFPLDEGRRVVTKLRLWLETGRKHQIRAQAAHAGFPLVGDRAYNPGYRGHKAVDALIDFPRQALHAAALELEHPNQPGRHMKWTADLPEDLRKLETNLRATQRR